MNRQTPRVLLLIPSHIAPDTAALTERGVRPRADYYAFQERLGADILDYSALDRMALPAIAHIARNLGRAAALAAVAYARAVDYDIIFTNSENIGIPLAILLRLRTPAGRKPRPGHVMIGHRLSARKKRPLLMAARSGIDAIFVYSGYQREFAHNSLGFAESQLNHISFHADHRFFRPLHPASELNDASRLVSSAGLEWRDYSTLMRAVTDMDVEVRIGADSPWSRGGRHNNWEAEKPRNVTTHRYDYTQLRALYDQSSIVVVPLHQTDFQAGITTVIEGMSMGKPVIASRTLGMADTLQDGVNGVLVPPGDVHAMREAIEVLVRNHDLARKLGAQARCDVESSLTLDHWVDNISRVICAVDTNRHCSAAGRGAATGRKQ